VQYYTTVMQQLDALGWQHVAEVDDDLRHLTLTHTYAAAWDAEARRRHPLTAVPP